MTADAVGKLLGRYAGLEVAGADFSRLVVVTGVAGIFLVRAGVAGLAGRLALVLAAVIEWKCVYAQVGRRPCGGSVAVGALAAEESGMHRRLLVAAGALNRGAFEAPVCMAGATVQGMAVFQREERLVVKLVHTVDPVVAIEAGRAVLGQVFGIELRVALGVAGAACTLVELLDIQRVAVAAGQRLVIVSVGMMNQ